MLLLVFRLRLVWSISKVPKNKFNGSLFKLARTYLCARVNRRPYTEPAIIGLIQYDPVKQKRLPRPVLASHSNHTNAFFNTLKEIDCILANLETYKYI